MSQLMNLYHEALYTTSCVVLADLFSSLSLAAIFTFSELCESIAASDSSSIWSAGYILLQCLPKLCQPKLQHPVRLARLHQSDS